jgi:hypothetical protein
MFKKERDSKQFFEIFKPHGKTKQVGFSIQNSERHQKNKGKDKKREQLSWIKDTITTETFQSGTQKVKNAFLNKVAIKQETLILGALCAVFLSLACFFAGYKIGHNKASNLETLQPRIGGVVKSIPLGKKIKAIDLSTNTSFLRNQKEKNIIKKWTLQIIIYSNTKQHMKDATNLAKAIRNMTGHSTFVAKRGKELIVCVGRFDSRNNTEIKNVLNEISSLKYEGKKQFASAYPIQIR